MCQQEGFFSLVECQKNCPLVRYHPVLDYLRKRVKKALQKIKSGFQDFGLKLHH